MKTNLLIRLAGIILAIIVTAGIAVSGNNVNKKGNLRVPGQNCLNLISGITPDQKTKIIKLNSDYQYVMSDLRAKQRSAADVSQKNQISKQMDSQIENHLKAVRSILSADQQLQLNQFCLNQGNQQCRYNRCCKGYGSGRCHRNGFGWNKQA
jgi:hypothetical protein